MVRMQRIDEKIPRQPAPPIAETNHGWGITCKCGHFDSHENFEKSASGIELDKGSYQCPKCTTAWLIGRIGKPEVFDNGFVLPAKREIIPVNPLI